MWHFGKRGMGLPKWCNHFISINVNCGISATVIQTVFSIAHSTITSEAQRSAKSHPAGGVNIAAMSAGN